LFTGEEITELEALETLEPWGYHMDNHRAAVGAWCTVAANCESGKAPEFGEFVKSLFGDRERDSEDVPSAEKRTADFVKANLLTLGARPEV